MKKCINTILLIVIVLSFTGCSLTDIKKDSDIETGEESVIEGEQGLDSESNTESSQDSSTDSSTESSTESSQDSNQESTTTLTKVSLDEWDSARMDFFNPYIDEPDNFETQEDYFYIICYMLMNHLESYSFTIEDPTYDTEQVYEILEGNVVDAYEDATLVLNTYTDFWSRLKGECSQKVDGAGNVLAFTYTFTLAQKDGLDSEEAMEELYLAEEACVELVDAMFEDGRLSSDMTEKERAYALYKWICENVDYAYDAPDSEGDEVKPDNCYSAMIERCAVCQGISGAYVQLCRLAGVDMYVQLGYTATGAHSWCKIEMDGTWYYIDPTWGITGADDDEVYSDDWFWVTQEFMESYPGNSREFTSYLEP